MFLSVPPSLAFSQAWRDLSRMGKSRAGDVNVRCLATFVRGVWLLRATRNRPMLDPRRAAAF